MPIYEYVCDDCGYDFERMQPFSAEPLKACPACGGLLRRVISPVGVIFKGSGWYITDSKRQLSGSPAKTGRQIPDAGEPAKDATVGEPAPATTDKEQAKAPPDGAKPASKRAGKADSSAG